MSDQDERPSATPEWRDADSGADAASDRTYDPSTAQVNRSREQGLGVGATELDAQRDPTRVQSAEQYGESAGRTRDLSPDGDGGPAQPDAGSESAESLDDARDQFEGGGS